MSAKREMLDTEDRAWRDMSARFASLAPEQWMSPGAAGEWSPKDVLAHIACWHSEAVQFFEVLREGGSPRWPDESDFNADARERCREMTLKEVQAMSGAARHRFREEIAALAEPVPEKHARAIANCGVNHYAEHASGLDAVLGKA